VVEDPAVRRVKPGVLREVGRGFATSLAPGRGVRALPTLVVGAFAEAGVARRLREGEMSRVAAADPEAVRPAP
jgi:hypothetical protein